MELIKEKSGSVPSNPWDLNTQNLITWLESPEGRSKVDNALESAHRTIQGLVESRKLTPEQLHEPITL